MSATLALLLLTAQVDEATKMAGMRDDVVARFKEFDAIDPATEPKRAAQAFAMLQKVAENFLWEFESYLAAYEAFVLLGKAHQKWAEAGQGEEHWQKCFAHLGRPRMLLRDPAVAAEPEVRKVVLYATAEEARARLAYARMAKDPAKQADALAAIVTAVAPTDAELGASEDAVRIVVTMARMRTLSGDAARACEGVAKLLVRRPLKQAPAKAPTAAAVKELAGKLGAGTIDERDDASMKLLMLGKAAVEALEEAAKSAETEVRSRASALLAAIAKAGESVTADDQILEAIDEIASTAKGAEAALALLKLAAGQSAEVVRRGKVREFLKRELDGERKAKALEVVRAAAGRELTASEAVEWLAK
jgi:hypothetical protein